MTHSSRNPLLSVKWPTSPKNSMHADWDNIKTWMTENQSAQSNWTTILKQLFSFHFRLPWNPPATVSLRDSITLLQDSFSVGTPPPPLNTSPPGWKNCTSFPFQNVSVKYKVACMFQFCYNYMVLVLLTSRNCYMSTLRLVHYALLLTPACWKSSNIQTPQESSWRLSHFVLPGLHMWN